MDLFAPHGVIKSTLWPASRKKILKVAVRFNNSVIKERSSESVVGSEK